MHVPAHRLRAAVFGQTIGWRIWIDIAGKDDRRSGFMFPFAGMPVWAQYLGEGLPLTHYVRIVRAIMLKGAGLANLQYDTIALIVLMLVAMTIAVTRFRRTLD